MFSVLIMVFSLFMGFYILFMKSSEKITNSVVASNINSEKVFYSLVNRLGDVKVRNDKEILKKYSSDIRQNPPGNPDMIVFAEELEDIEFVVKICNMYEMIISPMGSNTGLSGGTLLYQGGVILNLSKMKKVLDFQEKNQLVTVEAGIRVNELNEFLKPYGFMFPVLPGSSPSIGGGTSTRASGLMTLKYNTFKENVVRLQVVLPSGKTIWTRGSQTIKSAAGYDLTPLFIGSEGTLGVISKIQLKIVPLPEHISGGKVMFKTIKEAANGVIALKMAQIPGLAKIEILNVQGVRACNIFSGKMDEEVPTLFLEIHGSTIKELELYFSQVEKISEGEGGFGFSYTLEEEELKEMWFARINAYKAIFEVEGKKSRSGACKFYTTDICVPLSNFSYILENTEKLFEENGIGCAIVGHAADGNFHTLSCIDIDDTEKLERAEKVEEILVKSALKVGGTNSGEHGIGIKRLKYMKWEFEEDALDLMRTIKEAIDPKGIMNPGKVIPKKN